MIWWCFLLVFSNTFTVRYGGETRGKQHTDNLCMLKNVWQSSHILAVTGAWIRIWRHWWLAHNKTRNRKEETSRKENFYQLEFILCYYNCLLCLALFRSTFEVCLKRADQHVRAAISAHWITLNELERRNISSQRDSSTGISDAVLYIGWRNHCVQLQSWTNKVLSEQVAHIKECDIVLAFSISVMELCLVDWIEHDNQSANVSSLIIIRATNRAMKS